MICPLPANPILTLILDHLIKILSHDDGPIQAPRTLQTPSPVPRRRRIGLQEHTKALSRINYKPGITGWQRPTTYGKAVVFASFCT